jgi:hypothetical protein
MLGLYPQPAESFVYVSGLTNEKHYDVQVYDLIGKKMMQTSITSQSGSEPILNLSGLSSGIYQMIVSDVNTLESLPIIKQ